MNKCISTTPSNIQFVKNSHKYEIRIRTIKNDDEVRDGISIYDEEGIISTECDIHTMRPDIVLAPSLRFFLSTAYDYRLTIFSLEELGLNKQSEEKFKFQLSPKCIIDLDQRIEITIDKSEKYVVGHHYYDDTFSTYYIDENYKLRPLLRFSVREDEQDEMQLYHQITELQDKQDGQNEEDGQNKEDGQNEEDGQHDMIKNFGLLIKGFTRSNLEVYERIVGTKKLKRIPNNYITFHPLKIIKSKRLVTYKDRPACGGYRVSKIIS